MRGNALCAVRRFRGPGRRTSKPGAQRPYIPVSVALPSVWKCRSKPYERGRSTLIRGVRQLVHVDRKNRDVVMVRLVSGRRAWAAIAGRAEIGPALNGAFRHRLLARIAGVLRQRGCAGREVVHDPMPPAAAGGRVGIVDGHREAFRALGRAAPAQRRRDLSPLQPKPLNTCSLAIVAPSLISGLVKVIF